jgi:endonuclease/exonuclease/phosphatase family metal-dependent hydrolase
MRLRVITYNIHRAIGVDRRFKPARIAEILDHHRGDIVFLQEVDDGVPRSGKLDLAEELAGMLGYPYVAAGYNVKLRRGRYGNATLSRFPIKDAQNIDLTIGKRKGRGALYTGIQVSNGARHNRLDLFNLHLGLSASERVRQVGKLINSERFSGLVKSHACMIAGDFNDWRSMLHPIFTEILLFGCATQHAFNYRARMKTYPSFSPTGGLDKLYYKGPLRPLAARTCRMRLSRVASDHLPVIADFDFDL